MADEIGVIVTGDRDVSLKFDEFPQDLHDALLSRIGTLTDRLAGAVRSGVHARTGKLRGSISEAVYDDQPRKITGRVFVDEDYAKAGAIEYGAHGRAKVSAHEALLGHAWGKKLSSPVEVMVSAHGRQMNVVAQRFLRGPLASLSGDIASELQDATKAATQDVS